MSPLFHQPQFYLAAKPLSFYRGKIPSISSAFLWDFPLYSQLYHDRKDACQLAKKIEIKIKGSTTHIFSYELLVLMKKKRSS